MVRDEPVFLPIWLDYYSRHFDLDDIYVFDHQTTDGSTDGARYHRIPVTHDGIDHAWMVDTIAAKQHELLERYDIVLVTDVDEIVAPDPDFGTLSDYLDEFDEPFVTTQGWDVVHLRHVEPALDWDRPILEQRRHWFRSWAYHKPILATEPCTWYPGFHARTDGKWNPDERLFLLHLHRMDFDYCRQRHELRSGMRWNEQDVEVGMAAHNRIVDDAELEHWFTNVSEVPDVAVNIEEMPEKWQNLVLWPQSRPT
jgi:hypothetical protein